MFILLSVTTTSTTLKTEGEKVTLESAEPSVLDIDSKNSCKVPFSKSLHVDSANVWPLARSSIDSPGQCLPVTVVSCLF